VSASRRWTLLHRRPVRAFFGFGIFYQTESGAFSTNRLDFALQFGMRAHLPA